MDAKEGVERLKTTYLDRLKRLGSLNQGSTGIGEVEGYLAGQKDNKRGLRPQDVLRSQEALGNPLPEEVYHEALFSEEKDPAAILAYSREYQELRPDPFVTSLLPRLRLLAAAGATPAPSSDEAWESLQPAIRDLDRQRRRNRQAALKKLQQLIARALGQLEQGARPRQGIADLCTALGVLAAIYRLAGRRDDAVDLLVAARPLVIAAGSFKTEAEWYQKAAYLLVDLNRFKRGEEFIGKAHFLFEVAGATDERLRTLVDYGYVLTESLRYAEALVHLETILPLVPKTDIEGQLSAHQLMATNLDALGNLTGAQAHLEKAMTLVGDNLLAKAYCLWRLANIQAFTGQTTAAFSSFQGALQLFAKLTGATELAQLAMDYAAFLLKQGCRPELRRLAADLTGWLDRLRGHFRLRAIMENFQALVLLNELDDKTFALVREEFASLRETGTLKGVHHQGP